MGRQAGQDHPPPALNTGSAWKRQGGPWPPFSCLRFSLPSPRAKKNAAPEGTAFIARGSRGLLAAHARLQRVDDATDAIGIALGADFAARAAGRDQQRD